MTYRVVLQDCAVCCQNTQLWPAGKHKHQRSSCSPFVCVGPDNHRYKRTVTQCCGCAISVLLPRQVFVLWQEGRKDGTDCSLGCQPSSTVTLSRAVGWVADRQGSCIGERARSYVSLLGGVNSRNGLQLAQCLLPKAGFLLLFY